MAEAEPSGEATNFNFMMRSKPYIEVLTSGRGSGSPGANVLAVRFWLRSGLNSVLSLLGKFHQIKVNFDEVFHYICVMFSVLQNITKPALYKQNRFFGDVLPMFYLSQKKRCKSLIYIALTTKSAVRLGIEPRVFCSKNRRVANYTIGQ